MRGTPRNTGHSRVAFTFLFTGLLVLLCGTGAFAQNFTITPSVGSAAASGTITPNTAQTVAAGGAVTFTFAPAATFQLAQIIIDGVPLADVDAPAGDLDPKTGFRILTYTFKPVNADHTIRVTFEKLYTLTVAIAGPADPFPNVVKPGANRYVVAGNVTVTGPGTTDAGIGLYKTLYKYGDSVTVAFSTIAKDYKFGEDRSRDGGMAMQNQIYADASDDPLGAGADDLYWLCSNRLDNGATDLSSFSLHGTAIPQTMSSIIEGPTTITAWFVRADIIATTAPTVTATWTFPPAQFASEPVGNGNVFEPLDGPWDIGITYPGFPNGVTVQLQYEDGIPVRSYTTTPPIAVGPGSQICVDIAPNTGTPGAILFHPKDTDDTPNNSIFLDPGYTEFDKLQIDRPGADYQLEYKYYMDRADGTGKHVRPMPGDTAVVEPAVPISYSVPFTIAPAETAHFSVGYNWFGQLGIGLVTPNSPSELKDTTTGLPQPASWQRKFPTDDGSSQLMPQKGVTRFGDSTGDTATDGHSVKGPVGMMGLYSTPYPHAFEELGFDFNWSGWTNLNKFGFSTEVEWQGRVYTYPDDWFAQGRDHYEIVQPYHTSNCFNWSAYQEAFNSVSAGQMFSAALRDTGHLWMFGDNTYGQCGVGTLATATYTTPFTPQAGFQAFADPVNLGATEKITIGTATGNSGINSIVDVIGVASGFQHVVALKGDGTVWVWGRNNQGQLGLGSVDDQSGGHPAPAQVPGLANIVAVVSGDYYSFALKRDGSVWGWGLNSDGQLGDGTKTNRTSPVQVGAPVRNPDGTIDWRLGVALFSGHTSRILGAAASPDGRYVLTCSFDGTARLCDAATGQLVRTIGSSGTNAHTGPINAVAFSPDGTKIVTASSDRTARLWATDGTFLHTFVDTQFGTTATHNGSVTSVAFSPDGNFVVTGSVDTTAKVWNTAFPSPTYALVATCAGSTLLGVNAVAFSASFPVYNRVYVASGDQTVKIYDATTGALKRNFNNETTGVAHASSVTSLAVVRILTADFIVTGSTDCTAKVWQVARGSDTETLESTLNSMFGGNSAGHYDAVTSVAIALDSGFIYVLTGSRDNTVKRWSNQGVGFSWVMDESYTRHADSVNAVGFGYQPNLIGAQDRSLILTGSSDLTAVLEKTPIVTALAAGTSHSLALKEDGTVWAWGYNAFGQCGQGDVATQNYRSPVQVVNTQTAPPANPLVPFLQNVVGVSAGNAHSAVVTRDGNVLSWGSNTYGELAQGPGTVNSPAFLATPVPAVDEAGTAITGMQAVSAGWGFSLARGTDAFGAGAIYAWGHNNHGQLGIDGPAIDAGNLLNGPNGLDGNPDGTRAFPYATLWSSPIQPSGTTFGNSPMTTLSARYWHSQIVNFTRPSVDIAGGFHTMTLHVDPVHIDADPAKTVVGGVILADTSNAGAAAGTTSQSGVPGQTIWQYGAATSTVKAESGTTIRIIAIPRPGYTFDHFDGYAPSQTTQTSWKFSNAAELSPSTPLDVYAHFTAVPRKFQLTIVTNLPGAVATGAGTYNDGEVATIAAANDTNFTFDHWSGDPDIENSRLRTTFLRMSSDKTITANFVAATPTQFTLTIHRNPANGGTIYDSSTTPPTPLQDGVAVKYQQGQLVLLMAVPNANYVLSDGLNGAPTGWTDNQPDPKNPLSSTTTENTSLLMDGSVTAKDLTVTFQQKLSLFYDLGTVVLLNSQDPWGGADPRIPANNPPALPIPGTVTPATSQGFATVPNHVNTIVTVTAAPNPGFAFAGWSSNVTPDALNPLVGTVRMNQDMTLANGSPVKANFVQGNLPLNVQSVPMNNVAIVSPTGHGGTTNYAVQVAGNIPVTLVAPASILSGGNTFYFLHWTLNGFASSQGMTALNFVMGANETAIVTYEQDTTPPSVTGTFPPADSVQNPTDTIVRLEVTDIESHVDLTTVKVLIEGNTVYNGAAETSPGEYDTLPSPSQTVAGFTQRSGSPSDYIISFQPITSFHYGQTVHVTVNASDLAGNAMPQNTYAFIVRPRVFGANIQANTNGDASNGDASNDVSNSDPDKDHPPATICDASGNIWLVWAGNGSNIWLGELPAGDSAFAASKPLEAGVYARKAPVIARSPSGRIYIVWQDQRNGHWDLFGLSTTDGATGTEFPSPALSSFVSTDADQTNPAVAVAGNGRIYVAWEDASKHGAGTPNVFVAYSDNNGVVWQHKAAVSDQPFAQTHPSLVIDKQNNVYVFWSDSRNVPTGNGKDIYGASSADGFTWTVKPIISNTHNHTSPVVAVEPTGNVLHLAWVGDDTAVSDIYYASTGGGLPASPLVGTDIIDEQTSGQPHVAPAIAVTGSGNTADVLIAWQDARYAIGDHPQDTNIMFCEVFGGIVGPNVQHVNDETNATAQKNPCIGVDPSGQAYIAWEDNRVAGRMDIWFAGTASPDPGNTVSQALKVPGPYDLKLPDGTAAHLAMLPANAQVSLSKVMWPPPSRPTTTVGDCYLLGPSGIQFTLPVTITVPYDPKVFPWYPATGNNPITDNYHVAYLDYNSGLWLNDGISVIAVDTVLGTVQFSTSHFSLFSVSATGSPVLQATGTTTTSPSGSSGGGGGGCFIATAAYEAELPSLAGSLEVNCTGRYLIPADRLQKLNDIRGLRDSLLLRMPEGRAFSAWYYALAPYAANAIRDNNPAKAAVRTMLLNPLSEMSRMCGTEPQLKQ